MFRTAQMLSAKGFQWARKKDKKLRAKTKKLMSLAVSDKSRTVIVNSAATAGREIHLSLDLTDLR